MKLLFLKSSYIYLFSSGALKKHPPPPPPPQKRASPLRCTAHRFENRIRFDAAHSVCVLISTRTVVVCGVVDTLACQQFFFFVFSI